MLIVVKATPNASIKDHVFNEMAFFLKAKFSESNIYEYITDDALIQEVKAHNHKRVVISHNTTQNLCLTLSELKVVQILIGSNDDLTGIVDIIIDPLEKVDLKYFYGLNFMPVFLLDSKYAVDIAKYLQISLDNLKRKVQKNNAEVNLFEIISLIYELEWDSSFFGLNIAYLSSTCLTENIENYVKNFIVLNNIKLLQFKCNCHDVFSVKLAEDNNYSFVDIRLTMEKSIDDSIFIEDQIEGLIVQKAVESDIKILEEFSRDIYATSRYYYDNNFNIDKLEEFYCGWIRKAVLGLFDDFCYALYKDGLPIGFCSIKLNKGNSASIGIVGLNQNYSGLGLGRYMLNNVVQALYKDGITYIDVVTQGRNYGAQRLYQRCGFITRSTELWYHKWLENTN